MSAYSTIFRPAEHAEKCLIDAILDNQYAPGSILPAERELAAILHVTRPTLREALQRLERDGWLEIHQGKPTRVQNYLKEGNLAVLAAIAEQNERISGQFISDLLFVRIMLAEAYTQLAVRNNPEAIEKFLEGAHLLPDKAEAFCAFDWELHQNLTAASGNPVFALILNGFKNLYQVMGLRYFDNPDARTHSRKYYSELFMLVKDRHAEASGGLSKKVMEESREYWSQLNK